MSHPKGICTEKNCLNSVEHRCVKWHFLYSCKIHTCLLRALRAARHTTMCLTLSMCSFTYIACFYILIYHFRVRRSFIPDVVKKLYRPKSKQSPKAVAQTTWFKAKPQPVHQSPKNKKQSDETAIASKSPSSSNHFKVYYHPLKIYC